MSVTQNQELIRKIASQLGSDADGILLATIHALKAQAKKHGMNLEELFFFAYGDLSKLLGEQPAPVAATPQAANFGANPARPSDHKLFEELEHIQKSQSNSPSINRYGMRRRNTANDGSGSAWNKLSPWEKNFVNDVIERFGAAPFAFSPKQIVIINRITEKSGAAWADINF